MIDNPKVKANAENVNLWHKIAEVCAIHWCELQ